MAQTQKVLKEAGRLNVLNSSGVDNKVVSLTAAKTLDAVEDTGKIFILNLAAGFTVTLPAVSTAEGFNAKFVVGTVPADGANYVITENTAVDTNILYGVIGTCDGEAGAATEAAGATQVNLVAGAAQISDFVKVFCDGSKWLVTGLCADAAHITIT